MPVQGLLSLADAPDLELLAAVRRHGGRAAMDLVLDHALDVQERDPEALHRKLMLLDRIRVLLCNAYLDTLSSSSQASPSPKLPT